MSASPSQALDAIAFQLMAALEKYDADSARMVDTWPDLELYREVSTEIENIRMYSAALPEVRVQWVELLIAHAELIHFLWRVKYGESGDAQEEIASVREHHSDCVKALRNRSIRVIHRSQHFRGPAAEALPPRP
ncbi:MAG: hypothetical protein JWP41_2255 [Ramlibacter sp.]|jgi:hypothetical protein|nr:hypothetical protein [Ramlibacter sp.]